jgi:hypothetical protein
VLRFFLLLVVEDLLGILVVEEVLEVLDSSPVFLSLKVVIT